MLKGVTVMEKNARYHVLPNKNHEGVLIFDAETGAIQHPVCWQDLVAYYNYLVGLGRIEESQKLLADSMAGSKPITKMLEYSAKQN
jgi:hypothetical protein